MPLRLGDYADGGDWFFIAVCRACSRETILEPSRYLGPAGAGESAPRYAPERP